MKRTPRRAPRIDTNPNPEPQARDSAPHDTYERALADLVAETDGAHERCIMEPIRGIPDRETLNDLVAFLSRRDPHGLLIRYLRKLRAMFPDEQLVSLRFSCQALKSMSELYGRAEGIGLAKSELMKDALARFDRRFAALPPHEQEKRPAGKRNREHPDSDAIAGAGRGHEGKAGVR